VKWKNKYNINIEELHQKNMNGSSITDLSIEYGVPKTTLNRYLHNDGFDVLMNRKTFSYSYFVSKSDNDINYDYGIKNITPWKQALIYHFGHKCFVCGYDKIVEAHHILAISNGGLTTIKNGILLCPNCHAETHAELLNLNEALIKLGELLEHSIELKNNQQPSHTSKYITLHRGMEGSTTNSKAKAIKETRAPRSRSRRNGKDAYALLFPLLKDKI
jgi:hypothetical protein